MIIQNFKIWKPKSCENYSTAEEYSCDFAFFTSGHVFQYYVSFEKKKEITGQTDIANQQPTT